MAGPLRFPVDPRGRFGRAVARLYPLEQVDEARDVVAPTRPVGHLERVPARERCERPGEVVRLGHDGSADERGDDADVAHEGGLDLETHEVVLAVEPPLTGAVDDRQPARPDHREQHVARPDRGFDRFLELDPDVDGVDVHEDVLGSELLGEGVVETTSLTAGVLAPVADEDAHRLRHGGREPAHCRHWTRRGLPRLEPQPALSYAGPRSTRLRLNRRVHRPRIVLVLARVQRRDLPRHGREQVHRRRHGLAGADRHGKRAPKLRDVELRRVRDLVERTPFQLRSRKFWQRLRNRASSWRDARPQQQLLLLPVLRQLPSGRGTGRSRRSRCIRRGRVASDARAPGRRGTTEAGRKRSARKHPDSPASCPPRLKPLAECGQANRTMLTTLRRASARCGGRQFGGNRRTLAPPRKVRIGAWCAASESFAKSTQREPP